MQGHKDRYTGKLTGTHTGTHVPKGTLAGRQDTSSHGNTCILTQAYGHPRDRSTPPTATYTLYTSGHPNMHTQAEEFTHNMHGAQSSEDRKKVRRLSYWPYGSE